MITGVEIDVRESRCYLVQKSVLNVDPFIRLGYTVTLESRIPLAAKPATQARETHHVRHSIL